jgi:hypothetical protein
MFSQRPGPFADIARSSLFDLRQCASARTAGMWLQIALEAKGTAQMEAHGVPWALPPRIAESKPPRIGELLRKAIEWKEPLECGEVRNQTAITRREGIARAPVTQLMGLLRLAPEIQQHILRTLSPRKRRPVIGQGSASRNRLSQRDQSPPQGEFRSKGPQFSGPVAGTLT